MTRITEDGQGGFAIYEDGTAIEHIAKCADCHQPIVKRLTMALRLHGVKQQADLGGPSGPLCADCLNDQIRDMERGGLR